MKRSRITTSTFAISIVLAGLLLSACIKDEDFNYDKIAASNWDPDFAIPLINSSLGINNLTGFSNSTSIGVDSNDYVHLIYKANVYSVYGYQFLPAISQSNAQSFTLSAADSAMLYLNGSVTRTFSIIYPFSVSNGEQLDSMLLRAGALDFSIQSQIPHSGNITIDIPDALINGIPYSRNMPFSTAGGLPIQVSISDDLSGYKLDFSGNGSFNELRVNYSVTFTNSSPGTATTNRNFFINCDLNNLQMGEAYGYFGQRSLTVTGDSSRIELFNNSLFGNISFDDPRITFNISNSFGMPIYAQMSSLTAIFPGGSTTPITGAIPNPLPVPSPAFVGETVTDSFYLDKTNSNIATVMNQNPRYIEYDVDAQSNLPTPTYNFVTDSSLFNVDIAVDLPLLGTANGFTVIDTADFELENINELERAIFRINVSNGFPANAYVQVYFTDSVYTILDSLLADPTDFVIASGLLDINGKVILPNVEQRDEDFNKPRLENIYKTKKLVIVGIVSTQNAPVQMVPIYSTYRLDIKVGVRAFLEVDF
ncbi:MAG: hypothetical protein KA444_01910 [Bacteroidia bacterium]|nr:hypothetical protein [Bacteroidia bacterium]